MSKCSCCKKSSAKRSESPPSSVRGYATVCCIHQNDDFHAAYPVRLGLLFAVLNAGEAIAQGNLHSCTHVMFHFNHLLTFDYILVLFKRPFLFLFLFLILAHAAYFFITNPPLRKNYTCICTSSFGELAFAFTSWLGTHPLPYPHAPCTARLARVT